MYNLLLLWKHPLDNELLLDSLHHVLHDIPVLTTSLEYKRLLLHFLEKLYTSFPEAHRVICDYSNEDTIVNDIVQDLSETGVCLSHNLELSLIFFFFLPT